MKTRNQFSITLLALLLWLPFTVSAQQFALKTNLISDATATISVAGEAYLSEHYSAQLGINYNPFTQSNNKKTKLLLVRPELRYWLSETFYGTFLGLQAHYARFNFAGTTPITAIKNNRYQGDAYGASFTLGRQWMLSSFWNIEASVALGYLRLNYDKFGPAVGDGQLKTGYANYVGPTELNLSLIYFLR